jgi:hypothetical protein
MLAELTGHSKCHCYVFPTVIARDLLHPMFTDFNTLQLNGKTLSQYLNVLNNQIEKHCPAA